ncbi:MAG: glycosyltransferase [Desulfobacter sp.]|nr:MAG: glycosyltransferase [Desulfobacter sp.]
MIAENDPAGMGIAFTNAINRYTDHQCRLITVQDRYGIDFGKDIHLPDIHDDDFDEVADLLEHSDIIHFHMLRDEHSHLGPLVIRDYIKGKKIIHHHHGHPDYLINAQRFNDKYRKLGRRVIVSTPDLLHVADDAVWVPNLVPINDPPYLPRYETCLKNDRIRVCQAPTRKFDKHTDEFGRVLTRLQASHPQVEPVIIERKGRRECLDIKRKCHIVFDHMRGWFGISSLESLSQGKPVIAGLDEWNIGCIKEFTGADRLPWVVARNETELEIQLEQLVSEPDARFRIGMDSRKFMEDCWREQDALAVLLREYDVL